MEKMVSVPASWVRGEILRRGECPRCGSARLITRHENSETFEVQHGCLDCGDWLTPVICKEVS